MIVLAIDTSTATVSAGIVGLDGTGGVRTLAARALPSARGHAESLTPMIVECLAAAGHAMPDLDAVVVGAGPGPFTGLRVGMATAAAFGDALGVPVYGVCSLDAIAVAAGDAALAVADQTAVTSEAADRTGAAPAQLLVVTDARRREVYWARYSDGVRVHGPAVDKPDVVDATGVTMVAGSPAHARLYGLQVSTAEYPEPAALVRVVREEIVAGNTPEPLVPLYLRRPDATAPKPVVLPGTGPA